MGQPLGVEKDHRLDAGWQSRRYHRAGRGIGASCAKLFAREGCRVVVNDNGVDADGKTPRSDPADEVVAEIREAGGDAVAKLLHRCDHGRAARA